MATKRFIFFLLPLFLLTGAAFAQAPELKFEHITSEDGLPQNTIHGIVKDKYGFMWFGTWGGLSRYDGYSFKIYRNNPTDNRSINSNRIHNIIKDGAQNIWILTFLSNEVCRYNYAKDDFERIPVDKAPAAIVQLLNRRYHTQHVNVTHHQFKWSLDVQSNSLVRQDLATSQKKYIEVNPINPWSLNDSYVTDIYKDNHNIFWVGTYSSGVNKANLNAKPFEYYYHDPLRAESIIDNKVSALTEDKAGNLWVGTRDKGITVIRKDGYRHITAKGEGKAIRSNQIRRIFSDSRGIVWIGTKNGLDSYNPQTNTFRHFTANGLDYTSVYGITEDSAGDIWIATWRGIYKYSPVTDKMIYFNPKHTLKSQRARVILHDRKKQIWVGTEGGGISILRQVPRQDSLLVIKHFLLDSSTTGAIGDNRINTLYEDRDGFIWIGTGKGLVRYDQEKNKFKQFSGQSRLAEATVAAILEDDNGYLWISHKKGVSQLHKKTFAVRHFTLQDGLQSNEFADGAAYKSQTQNKLYLGGSNGFNAFNPDQVVLEKTLPNTVLTSLEILNHKVSVNEEVNGRVVLTKPLYLTDEIVLTYHDKSVAIEFAGLHYSNPAGNKYAYKLEGFDKDWVYTDASRRIATYSNLKPDTYVFKVISSNSDGFWNKEPALLTITVRPPLWASTWAFVLYGGIILGFLYLYHYYSLRYSRLKTKLSYELLIKEKENELHQNKLQFFTNISHEIKTPLTLILAPVEKLMHLFSSNQVIASELKTMQANGDRLLKLIHQLLDFRKLETGNLELHLQRKDIVSFLQQIVESFAPLAEVKNVKLEFSSSTEACSFPYDEDKLEKVLSNLLSNALKFTPTGGWVRLAFRLKGTPMGKTAIIEVVNVGKAIPEDDYEKIFKPFQQVAGTKEEGTGIGLAYTKGLVELHGGTISVKCMPGGEYAGETSFVIELPLRANDANMEQEDEERSVLSPDKEQVPALHELVLLDQELDKLYTQQDRVLVNGKVPVLLIVEDNAPLRQYLREFFESQYEVMEAENGAIGLEIALQALPDLVVSDVTMPEMDGFEFCAHLKTDLKTAHIPVVLLTARTPVEDELAGIETGADDYITKPFNLALLTARVRNLLVSRNKLKERYRREISLEPLDEVPLSADEKMLQKVMQYVEERLSDADLTIEDICTAVGVSRTQLYRKVKAMTGLGMAEVIKEIRLTRAKHLLKERKFNVNEVAFMTGFSDPDYFRKCFKAEFGKTPSEYCREPQEQGG